MERMRFFWAGLLAVGIHAVVGALARFPSIEKRFETEDWDLLISFRTDPPPLLATHREDDSAATLDRPNPVDEMWEDDYIPLQRSLAMPEG